MAGQGSTAPSTATARRGRGRPRLVDLDDRILRAAIDEICVSGVGSLTFDRVAAVSGVAKTTIYRRWANKTELMVDAIDLLRSGAPVPDTGDARADLTASLDNMLRVFTAPEGAAIAAVLAECRLNPELAAAWEAKIAEPHRTALVAVFERGVASGQLRRALAPDESLAVIDGIAFLVLFGAHPVRPGLAADVVRAVLDGMGTKEARRCR